MQLQGVENTHTRPHKKQRQQQKQGRANQVKVGERMKDGNIGDMLSNSFSHVIVVSMAKYWRKLDGGFQLTAI